MSDIFHEVEEDVRRDQLVTLWRRYGPFLIAGLVGLVLTVAAISAWRSYDTRRQAERARGYLAASALLADDPAAAAEAFEAAAREGGGYAVLARLKEAEGRLLAGDRDHALALYDEIAADAGVDPLLRQLASLRAGYLLMDRASLSDLRARLAPLTDESSTWRFSARELLAFAALAGGDVEAAKSAFAALAVDPVAPPSLQARASEMTRALGIEPVTTGTDQTPAGGAMLGDQQGSGPAAVERAETGQGANAQDNSEGAGDGTQ